MKVSSSGRKAIAICILCTIGNAISPRCSAQDSEPYLFYHGRDYGTEAVFHPLSLLANGGYGILQYPNRSRKIFELDYSQGFRNVMSNLSHPFPAINAYGWRDFIENEIIPGNISRKNAQYWPNYQNHLIGGGMDFTMVSEWYRYHGYPYPRWLGLGTMIVNHLFNETIENNTYDGYNVDPIADLCVFDPLGFILWSIHGVPEFFANTLNMADWPGQPDYNPFTRSIENQGINYSLKYRPPFSKNIGLFYYWGLTGILGLSYKTEDGRNISVGAGLRAKELEPVGDQSGGRKLTTELTWNTGFFYDRENTLLASVLFSGISDYRLHINVYPGLVGVAGFSPGFFCAFGENGQFVAGLNVSAFPFGLAAGRSE